MITVGGIEVESLNKLMETWVKDDNIYRCGNVSIKIMDYGCKIGYDAKLGNNCELGDYVKLGYDCKLGDYVKLGFGCELGDYVKLGDRVKLGDNVKLGDYCELGCECELGDNAKLSNNCELGDYVKLDVPPLWFIGLRHSIGYYSPGVVNSGCITKPISWWEENIKRCAEEYGYKPIEIEEYAWRIKVLSDWMKLHNVYELPAENNPEMKGTEK